MQPFWGRLYSLIFCGIASIIHIKPPGGWLKTRAEIRSYYKCKSSNHTLGSLSTRHPSPSPSPHLTHYTSLGTPRRTNPIPAPFSRPRTTSISCYFIAIMSLFYHKTPNFSPKTLKNDTLSLNFHTFPSNTTRKAIF